MLEIVQPSPTLQLPDTYPKVVASALAHQAKARESFWVYRQMIDSGFVRGWWQRDAAWWLQEFYRDIEAGKRPKLVLQAPPQHGKSRMVTDFITWAAGQNPDFNTIFASYSDELGTAANLRFQRILELPVYRKIWGNTRLADPSRDSMRWQRNTSVCEYVDYKGSFRVTTVNGQITGHGLHIGVVDDPMKGRAEASSKTIRGGQRSKKHLEFGAAELTIYHHFAYLAAMAECRCAGALKDFPRTSRQIGARDAQGRQRRPKRSREPRRETTHQAGNASQKVVSMVRCRRDTTFRKADVVRAIRAAQAVGISNPRIEIDRHGTITIVLGEPSKDNGAAAPDTPESIIEQL